MPQYRNERWASSDEKVEYGFGSFKRNVYFCTRWWVIKTAGGTSSGVHWMHFIVECGIEYGFQFVTQIFINSPDCLYIKKSWEFLQSYKKTRCENKLWQGTGTCHFVQICIKIRIGAWIMRIISYLCKRNMAERCRMYEAWCEIKFITFSLGEVTFARKTKEK